MATVSPYKRDLPFIHRAWKTAVDHLPYGMGIKLSTANGDTSDNDDHAPRAAKRLRTSEDSPELARAVPGRLLADILDDVEKVLRIEVLSITRADDSNPRPNNLHYGNGSPEKKDIPVIKACCRIIIGEWHQPDMNRVLYSDSQTCNFKVFRDTDDACRTARVYLPAPFLIPAEKLFVERRDDRGFNLADEYLVRVEISSAGDAKWPPVDLLSEREDSDYLDARDSRRWVLSSEIIYAFEKGRASGDVKLQKERKEKIPLDLTLDMDLRWSSRHSAGSSVRFGDSALSSDTTASRISRGPGPSMNGHVSGSIKDAFHGPRNGEIRGSGIAQDEGEREESSTPSRSLRTRGKQNYNLKLLSDKAGGKETKEKKPRKPGTLDMENDRRGELRGERNSERKGESVTWAVPLVGEFTLEGFDCIRCFAAHSSIHQLQKHMEAHTDILCTVDPVQSHIRILAPDEDAFRQLNSTSRHVSNLEDAGSDWEVGTSPSKLPQGIPQQRNEPSQSRSTRSPDNRRLVPHIKHPLYDRLSKALLEPGSLIDPPPVDDSWLVQKHQDIIRDYTDVHPDEKEYISEWDMFVNRDYVTSEPHLQDLYINFLRQRAAWIAASQNRVTEWAKHLSYLKSRDALTDKTTTEAFTIMRQARSQIRPEQVVEATKAPSPKSGYRKSVAGCPVCGQPVRGAASLICSNLDCKNALYHIECIREQAKQPVESRSWRCNYCVDEQKGIS
ncbi:hypothetical protein GGR50DRAFT_215158 [Xylaria sp. CBS 124048]|nr:hypothetical protein GGR50DRAFT_215158 [Xylaria sp. CBS 124048]